MIRKIKRIDRPAYPGRRGLGESAVFIGKLVQIGMHFCWHDPERAITNEKSSFVFAGGEVEADHGVDPGDDIPMLEHDPSRCGVNKKVKMFLQN